MDTIHVFVVISRSFITYQKNHFLAAAIDGASPIRKFIYVTFPLMAPISIGAIIIRLIEASKIMDTVYVLTSGGPGTQLKHLVFIFLLKD
jgi:multiple sugar transport system permease protein